MRIVSWNIRAGGGVRAQQIASQLAAWRTDIAVLLEFRGTEASTQIAALLHSYGLGYQRTTVDRDNPAVNSVLIASRWPMRRVHLQHAPDNPRRWLHVNIAAPEPVALMGIHIPNRSTGIKYPFMESVIDVVQKWRGPPAIIAGDTNSGLIGVDEESPAFNKTEDGWIRTLQQLNWIDIFRHQTTDNQAIPDHTNSDLAARKQTAPDAELKDSPYTWYSPNGRNGFRLDQMFLERRILQRHSRFSHCWGGDTTERLESLSDHAALILDLD